LGAPTKGSIICSEAGDATLAVGGRVVWSSAMIYFVHRDFRFTPEYETHHPDPLLQRS